MANFYRTEFDMNSKSMNVTALTLFIAIYNQ